MVMAYAEPFLSPKSKTSGWCLTRWDSASNMLYERSIFWNMLPFCSALNRTLVVPEHVVRQFDLHDLVKTVRQTLF